MKSLRVALIVPTLLLSATAFAQAAATRDVPDFHGVEVSQGLKAKVTVGPKSVRISGDEKVVSQIRTDVEDGKLVVHMEKKNGWFGSTSTRGVEITISSPQVKSVGASGGSRVEAEASSAETFDVDASGGGSVSVRNVDAKKVKVDASGGAVVTLKGRAEKVEVDASGGVHVDAQGLSHKELSVDASGGTVVEANPSDRVNGDLSGGCVIRMDSNPSQREISTSGGSTVSYGKK